MLRIIILIILILIVDSIEIMNSSSILSLSVNKFQLGYELITKRPDNMPLQPVQCGEGTLRTSPMTGSIINAILFNNKWDIIEKWFYEYHQTVDYFIV